MLVTGFDFVLVVVVEFNGLAQREDEFRSVVAGEGRDELLFGCLAAVVSMERQHGGVGGSEPRERPLQASQASVI